MHHTLLRAALFTSFLFLEGCASQQPTGMDKVTTSRKNINQTDERLIEAQDKLTDFQKTLKGLKTEFATSGKLSTQVRASETIERLSYKIDQAQLDLKELTSHNRAVGRDLDARLNEVAKQNDQISNQ